MRNEEKLLKRTLTLGWALNVFQKTLDTFDMLIFFTT